MALTIFEGQVHVYLADPSTGRKVCALWGKDEDRWRNARLFAVADDLLKALQALVTEFDLGLRDSDEAIARAKSAIAAAAPQTEAGQ